MHEPQTTIDRLPAAVHDGPAFPIGDIAAGVPDQSITLIVEADGMLLGLSAELPLARANFRDPVRLFLATLEQLNAAGEAGDSDPEAGNPQ